MDLLINLFIATASFSATWYLTHRYYKKSLENQAIEAKKELSAITNALNSARPAEPLLLMQQIIDGAVAEWKEKGTAVHYLDSLSSLSQQQKFDILRSASLRYKGREPKHNPYTE